MVGRAGGLGGGVRGRGRGQGEKFSCSHRNLGGEKRREEHLPVAGEDPICPHPGREGVKSCILQLIMKKKRKAKYYMKIMTWL